MSEHTESLNHRFIWYRRTFLVGLLAATAGCQSVVKRGQNLDEVPIVGADKKKTTALYVGDIAGMWGLNYAKVEGIGLVTGLKGTGSDPAPSWQREHLITELKSREGVGNTKELLASTDTSLVLIQGMIPPGARANDTFDLEVILQPKSETTNLDWGYLAKTRLRPMVFLGRKTREGHVMGDARGAVLVDALFESRQDQSNQTRGWILGGGKTFEDRNIGLSLRGDSQSVRTASMVGRAINDRFVTITRDGPTGVAQPKSDKIIELMIPNPYRHNLGRYSQVIGQIVYEESAKDRIGRMDQLAQEILEPISARLAALRLEALGKDGVPALQKALTHPDLEVQFYAAEALAYQGEADGVGILEAVAKSEPALRWHALTALSSLPDVRGGAALANLLHVDSAEARYGAFRAMRARNPDDPLVRGDWVANDYYLHVIPSTSTPMLHLTSSKRPEVVLFGEDQHFSPDTLYIETGLTIKNAGANTESLQISHFSVDQGERTRQCSTAVGDVIRTMADLGLPYSVVVRVCRECKQKGTLNSRLAINAVPRTGLKRESEDLVEGTTDTKSNRFVSAPLPELFRTSKSSDEQLPRDDSAALESIEQSKSGDSPKKSLFARMGTWFSSKRQ